LSNEDFFNSDFLFFFASFALRLRPLSIRKHLMKILVFRIGKEPFADGNRAG
jgi:hypothetical protein